MLASTLAHQWLYWNQLQSMELYSHQFFSFFELSVAEALRKDVTLKTFPAQTVVFEEGESSDCLYLVLTGKVELCKRAGEGSYLTIAFASENGFFGELGVLDGSARSTRAVTVEETTLARLAREPVLNVLRHNSRKPIIDMFNRIIQQLRVTDERYVTAVVHKEKMMLVGEMANTIIHDLRSPCQSVSMASLLINQLHSDEKTQRFCKIIQNQVDRMASMVEELLEFSRGTHQLKRQTISLAALMEQFAFLNQEYLHQNGIVLEIRPADVPIHVDLNKLLRVLQNLVYNAADALKDRAGRIVISGSCADGAAEICVQDNGPGIPEDIKQRLFEPFVTSGKKGGTGLGLAIAKSIVEAHHGQIRCESTPGSGAAFYVRLPHA